MNGGERKNYDLSLSLTTDQYDDLTTALEDHRDGLRRLAGEASNGFGLGAGYWTERAGEVQNLLDAVRRLAGGESAESIKGASEKSPRNFPRP